jgi:predicted methyltransferase
MEPRYAAYRLFPTDGAPALVVDGVLMHRRQGTTPDADAREKVRALRIRGGRVLDTCAGLGYSAIAAAEAGAHVLAVEVDPGVLAAARGNPASAGLFEHPSIALVLADSVELVAALPSGAFAAVLHDPPTLSRAGDLYAGTFYRELHRVLARHGQLFHYTGEPGAARGRDVASGVVRRLEAAGFRARIEPRLAGVLAEKRTVSRGG